MALPASLSVLLSDAPTTSGAGCDGGGAYPDADVEPPGALSVATLAEHFEVGSMRRRGLSLSIF